jgi:hypothetical protein
VTNKQTQVTWIDRPGLLLPPWREIPLSNGIDVALVDEADFERCMERKWHAHWAHGRRYKYASCNITKIEAAKYGVNVRGEITERDANGRIAYTRTTLHQFLKGRRPGYVLDHKNGNALDCRSANLRWATHRGNSANQTKRVDCSSTFKGVFWSKQHKGWVAQIRHIGEQSYLGKFENEIDAARVYDAAARRLFGEFARPNFPA